MNAVNPQLGTQNINEILQRYFRTHRQHAAGQGKSHHTAARHMPIGDEISVLQTYRLRAETGML